MQRRATKTQMLEQVGQRKRFRATVGIHLATRPDDSGVAHPLVQLVNLTDETTGALLCEELSVFVGRWMNCLREGDTFTFDARIIRRVKGQGVDGQDLHNWKLRGLRHPQICVPHQ